MANDFSYAIMFNFEKNFDQRYFLKWLGDNWTLSFWYAALYVTFIFVGKSYMEKRPRFELRTGLILWSASLALFSVMGMIRTLPELIHMIRYYGIEQSLCNPSYFYGPTAFWAFTFTISKVYELGDTVFIVMRKQPLIFLHWYHHVTVLIYVWYSYTDHTAPGRWFMVMNYIAHSFMYSYYTLRAMQVRVPKWVSMFITALQLSQMVIGVTINLWTYAIKSRGDYCQQSYENLRYSSIMYLSYFLLFGYFFYTAYLKKHPTRSALKPVLQDNCPGNGVLKHNGFVNGLSNGVSHDIKKGQ